MIDKVIARDLLLLVNDKRDMDALLRYVSSRVAALHTAMENTVDIHELTRLQGAIKEMKRFFGLRDEVIKDSRDGRD